MDSVVVLMPYQTNGSDTFWKVFKVEIGYVWVRIIADRVDQDGRIHPDPEKPLLGRKLKLVWDSRLQIYTHSRYRNCRILLYSPYEVYLAHRINVIIV